MGRRNYKPVEAGSECLLCTPKRRGKYPLTIHHVHPVWAEGDNRPENKVVLCHGCHTDIERVYYRFVLMHVPTYKAREWEINKRGKLKAIWRKLELEQDLKKIIVTPEYFDLWKIPLTIPVDLDKLERLEAEHEVRLREVTAQAISEGKRLDWHIIFRLAGRVLHKEAKLEDVLKMNVFKEAVPA